MIALLLLVKNIWRNQLFGLSSVDYFFAVVPSKDTMYVMLTLDNVTTDNIQAIGKTGKDVVDYITDQIDKIVNKDDEKENKWLT